MIDDGTPNKNPFFSRGEPLNMPISLEFEPTFEISISVPAGGTSAYVSLSQAKEYNEDPDLWAAKYFGVSKEIYSEWCFTDGTPFCAAETKTGKLCKQPVGGRGQLRLNDWMTLHRKCYCKTHGG